MPNTLRWHKFKCLRVEVIWLLWHHGLFGKADAKQWDSTVQCGHGTFSFLQESLWAQSWARMQLLHWSPHHAWTLPHHHFELLQLEQPCHHHLPRPACRCWCRLLICWWRHHHVDFSCCRLTLVLPDSPLCHFVALCSTYHGVLCTILPADFVHFHWPWFEQVYKHILDFLMQESEKVSPSSQHHGW